jgi:hypothetical protein
MVSTTVVNCLPLAGGDEARRAVVARLLLLISVKFPSPTQTVAIYKFQPFSVPQPWKFSESPHFPSKSLPKIIWALLYAKWRWFRNETKNQRKLNTKMIGAGKNIFHIL